MDFPTPVKNGPNPRQALTIAPPEFDADADNAKTPEAKAVEQQWRDVVSLGIADAHPLSINRDAAEVTADPYTS